MKKYDEVDNCLVSNGLDDTFQRGTSFLLANGHLGYRGTLSEERKDAMVALNICGLYDKVRGKWRESVNVYNPLFIEVRSQQRVLTPKNGCKEHRLSLNLHHNILERKTKFDEGILCSTRFIHFFKDTILGEIFSFTATSDGEFEFIFGIDQDIYELNGPHLKKATQLFKPNLQRSSFEFVSITSTRELGVKVATRSIFTCQSKVSQISFNRVRNKDFNGLKISLKMKKGQEFKMDVLAEVLIGDEESMLKSKNVKVLYHQHKKTYLEAFTRSRILIDASKEAQFALDYSVFSMLILGSKLRTTSIPARGLSGQVYKGAIFWDTEIFMLPFFLINDLRVARNLLIYRYHGLIGALEKAKRFKHQGAFYAWESQEAGKEACSLYNVTDAITGKPIRTYFADKQIHISADVLYGFMIYHQATNDFAFIKKYAYGVFREVYLFYRSYAFFNKKKDRYELRDVLGPDEYHERVNNNAFTNYLVYFTLKYFCDLFANDSKKTSKMGLFLDEVLCFVNKIYLPKPNENNIIEQFDGYFAFEDINPSELQSRMETSNEYWGKKAALTRVIKQADVITLLALFKEHFTEEVIRANYEFYLPYTEHGSSLSSSMYAIVASRLRISGDSFNLWYKSASIDIIGASKQYAGGIFIGGSHPASLGGAILTILKGFLDMNIVNGKYIFKNNLPPEIKGIRFKYTENELLKEVEIK